MTGKAPVAVMTANAMPPPPRPVPRPDHIPRSFSKFKPFGLRMFLKYKPAEEYTHEGEDTTGIKIQHGGGILTRGADLEPKLIPDDRALVGVCTIKVKRWVVEHGESLETSIEQLEGLTNEPLLNQQVCLAVVRMLWHSGPLGILCKDHLVMNEDKLGETEVWKLLTCIGFKPCSCPEFSLYEVHYDDQWCLGIREGSIDTAKGWDESEEKDLDDDDDDEDELAG